MLARESADRRDHMLAREPMKENGQLKGVARLLFVCVENSCRSQMAEAFARILGGDAVSACSGGSRPSGVVNARAIEAMAEVGYDLGAHRSKGLDGAPPGPYDAVVTMGCGDSCPAVAACRRAEWLVRDPKGLTVEEFRAIRDEIGSRVEALLEELGVAHGSPPVVRGQAGSSAASAGLETRSGGSERAQGF